MVSPVRFSPRPICAQHMVRAPFWFGFRPPTLQSMAEPFGGPLGLLLEPLSFPFMQRALAATLIVAVACAVVGVFVVTRGLAFVGDALAHASFAGVALA